MVVLILSIVEKLFFIILLFRACITDYKFRIIENEVILFLFINKVCIYMIEIIVGIFDIHSFFEFVVENILFFLFLFIIYYVCKTVGGGDIKILCMSILYFTKNEVIKWLFILLFLLIANVLNSIIRKKDMKIAFAPYIFQSVLLYYLGSILQ